jgi:transposase
MIKFKIPDKPKFLSFSFYDKDEVNKLFYEKLMIETKNIYNLTLFCYNIFDLYKKNIYDDLLEIVKKDINLIKNNNKLIINTDYDLVIIDKLIYYFDEYVKIKDQIKINNTEIYKYIINYINSNNIILTKNNFDDIYKNIYNNLLNNSNLITTSNKYILFDSIIYNILYSIYNKNFVKIKNIILNHEALPTDNSNIYNDLINEIKNNIYMECIKSSNVKEEIDDLLKNNLFTNKLKANITYIGRFIYKKLGNKTKYIQSTMISQVINKVTDSISSYYKLLSTGKKANKPKFLKHTDIFNLFYVYSDIVIKNNKVYLYTSEYLSKNFSEVFGSDYIYLANNKYVHKKYLNKINNQKIKKKTNYIYNNYYILKNHKNIIDSRYIIVDIFKKIQKEKIKTIEIKKVFGTYKIIFTYENNNNDEASTIDIPVNNMISIDLGVNNLLTIYDPTGKQYIISGGPLKSLNYYVTKKIAKGQKEKDNNLINKYQKLREDKINDYFNKIVKWLTITYSHKDLIIIGYNKSWKQNSNLGKKGNLSFNKIPFIKLINKIKMKFNIITTEESYTSKCDSLSLEKIEKKEIYSGKRVKRGLFKSSINKKINADLNGAINIMRKQINLTKITGESLYNPIRVNIMKKQQNLNKLLMDEVFYLPVHLNIFHEVNPVDNVY